jgi:electron transfer flavoprotein alpha subunit
MATVQAGAVDIDDPDYSRSAALGRVDNGAQPLNTFDAKVVDFVKGDPKGIDISEADIIVAGGRGMESKGSFNFIEEMADLIGGSVGGSRVAADKGWIPFSRQVGISGKTTTPEIFIACGISGAVQFQAGMKNSKHILAINKDRYAPIFGIADIKVLGDLHKILPLLVEKLKKAKKEGEKLG